MNTKEIKAIIFDFGGVIIDIDPQLTINEFVKLGFSDVQKTKSDAFTQLIRKFERGILTPEVFRGKMKKFLGIEISDQQFDDAWNALLFDIPNERIEIIEQVKENYQIFLLSNSNEIHYDLYVRDLQLRFGYREFADLFHNAYFSFDLHLSKPDIEVYEFVINQHDLDPDKTLFIDDNTDNINTAQQAGLQTYLLQKPERVRDIFSKGLLKDIK
ncbi:MAG: HAD family phosphatase [Bacteroidales bacterium]|nr:HAD family phosphatase [Bacteroidales bacterium]